MGRLERVGINGDHGPGMTWTVVNIGGYGDDAVRRGVNTGRRLQPGWSVDRGRLKGILIGKSAARESR